MSANPASPVVTEVNIYPIKSTGQVRLGESVVEPRGLAWDRRWMLIDERGRFLTGREYPKLTQVVARVTETVLSVSAPGCEKLEVAHASDDDPSIPVEVWGDETRGVIADEAINRWFSDYLGDAVRLLQMTAGCARAVAAEFGRRGDEVSYADVHPMLLVSQASLAELNRRASAPMIMQRFRPNVVVSGCEAHAEDDWRAIRIGEVRFEGTAKCARCNFTTIDPTTSDRHPRQEPLRTLATYRRRADGAVLFGKLFIPRSGGIIRVGDRVDVD